MADTPIKQPGTPLRLIGVDVPQMRRIAPDSTPVEMRQSQRVSSRDSGVGSNPYRRPPEQRQVDTRNFDFRPTDNRVQTQVVQPGDRMAQIQAQGQAIAQGQRESQKAEAYDRVQRLAISYREKLAAGDTAGLTGLREDVVDVLSEYRFLEGDDVRELQQIVFNDYREDQDYRVGVTRTEARQTRDAVIETQVRQNEVRIAGIQEAIRMAPTPQKQQEALDQLEAIAQEIQNSESLDARTKAALLSATYSGAGTLTREGQERFQNVNNMSQAQAQIADLQDDWREGKITAGELNRRSLQIAEQFGFELPSLGNAAQNAMFEFEEQTRVLEVANNRTAEQGRTQNLQLDNVRREVEAGKLSNQGVQNEVDAQRIREEQAIQRENNRQRSRDDLNAGVRQYSMMTPAQQAQWRESVVGRTTFGKAVASAYEERQQHEGRRVEVQRQVTAIDVEIQELQEEDINSQLRRPGGRDEIMGVLLASNPSLAAKLGAGQEAELTPEERQQAEAAARQTRQSRIRLKEQERALILDSYAQDGLRFNEAYGTTPALTPRSLGGGVPLGPQAGAGIPQAQVDTNAQAGNEGLQNIVRGISGLGQATPVTVESLPNVPSMIIQPTNPQNITDVMRIMR